MKPPTTGPKGGAGNSGAYKYPYSAITVNDTVSAQDSLHTRVGYLEDRVYILETRNKALTNSLTRAWNFLTWTLTIGVPTAVALGAGLLAVALR